MKHEPIWEVIPPDAKKVRLVMPHRNLRGRMGVYDIDQAHLARMLKRGTTYVSLRMNGRADWALSDCLIMMKAFNIPKEHFLDYFGRDSVPLEFH